MNKKRFSPQKNIARISSSPQEEKHTKQSSISPEEGDFATIIKNVSHSYKKHKQHNIIKNTIFLTAFILLLL